MSFIVNWKKSLALSMELVSTPSTTGSNCGHTDCSGSAAENGTRPIVRPTARLSLPTPFLSSVNQR